MTWVFLTAAIVAEVTATIALKYSDGFSKLIPSVVVGIGYITAFAALSFALERGMRLGIAYGVWAAAGVALVALIGAAFLGEPLTAVQVGGIGLIIGGVLALELGGAH